MLNFEDAGYLICKKRMSFKLKKGANRANGQVAFSLSPVES